MLRSPLLSVCLCFYLLSILVNAHEFSDFSPVHMIDADDVAGLAAADGEVKWIPGSLPERLRRWGEDAPSNRDKITNVNSSKQHHMKTWQATETFYMVQRTDVAPWSEKNRGKQRHPPMHRQYTLLLTSSSLLLLLSLVCVYVFIRSERSQPAFLYMTKAINYRTAITGILVSTSDSWTLFFEGSLTDSSAEANENDIWASIDDGLSWSLIGGVSRRGTSGVVPAWSPNLSFTPRGGSSQCEDPGSDDVYSIGGFLYNVTIGAIRTTNEVWRSTDGRVWTRFADSQMPPRYFSSCQVDIAGRVFSIGGIAVTGDGSQSLYNDVWSTAAGGWVQMVARAPWAARDHHVTMIATGNRYIGKEIIYVIGGEIQLTPSRMTNDVWASSDKGITWTLLCTAAPFAPRWGHGGVITSAGVLLIWGGANTLTGNYYNTFSYRDMWASFDGGINWKPCNLPDDNPFIRAEQSATLDAQQRLVIAAGSEYINPNRRVNHRDVWRTPFSLRDPLTLAAMCGGVTPVIRSGMIGLKQWPRTSPSNDKFIFNALSARAPWSPRVQPAFLAMSKPVNYIQVGTSLSISTPNNWLLMYEGSVTDCPGIVDCNENDVWASADNGATWDLIAGISHYGYRGLVAATKSTRSFEARASTSNCEDPTNDDVYSLGGLTGSTPDFLPTNEVWFSTDAITWIPHAGHAPLADSFSPRYRFSCDIDNRHVIYVVGGGTFTRVGSATRLLNDVWQGRNEGREWVLVCEAAPWAARNEHALFLYSSDVFLKEILYVIGGLTVYNSLTDVRRVINDVWASSDGGVEWSVINAAPSWAPRWGHAVIVAPSNGVILLVGGANAGNGAFYSPNMHSFQDVWLSYDGGYTWKPCGYPAGVDWSRTRQAIQLTTDERVILAAGYFYWAPNHRREYADVYISEISLSDIYRLTEVCPLSADGTPSSVQPSFIGLHQWPGGPFIPVSVADTSDGASKVNGPLVAGIICGIVAVAIIGWCCYSKYRKNGRTPMPNFMRNALGLSGGENSDAEPLDYTAFTILPRGADVQMAQQPAPDGPPPPL